MSDDARSKETVQARDIFGPSATVIGLLLASVAFLYSTSLTPSTLQELTDLALYVILFFALSAAFQSMYLLMWNRDFLRLSLLLFIFGWVMLLFTAINLLSSLAYNLNILQAIDINSISLSNFSLILSIIFFLVVIIGVFLNLDRKIQRDISHELKDNNDANRISKSYAQIDTPDLVREFLFAYIEIEKMLRILVNRNTDKIKMIADDEDQTVKREASLSAIEAARLLKKIHVIDSKTYASIDDIRPIRNSVVHARKVSNFTLRQSIKLATFVSDTLKKILDGN